jgi:hypothetical protein
LAIKINNKKIEEKLNKFYHKSNGAMAVYVPFPPTKKMMN